VFDRQTPQFKVQAVNKEAHNGYQTWHRAYDDGLVAWINKNQHATPNQFLEELNRIYGTDDMVKRFGEVKFK
jgi:hypothetical protein